MDSSREAGSAEPQDLGVHGVQEIQAPILPPTSRVCVKNLPSSVDERRLKEFFSGKGEVTDAKVMRTR